MRDVVPRVGRHDLVGTHGVVHPVHLGPRRVVDRHGRRIRSMAVPHSNPTVSFLSFFLKKGEKDILRGYSAKLKMISVGGSFLMVRV